MTDNYKALAFAAESVGGVLMSDQRGMEDIFCVFTPSGSDKALAFVGKETIYMGKYPACMRNENLYSLPLEMPQTALTFDEAAALIAQKGAAYHMMTLSEWALLCERATESVSGHIAKTAKTFTGCGSWNYAHNGRWSGVWDAAGNVRAWIAGYRTVGGEIQIIPDNSAADAETDELGGNSTLWNAISANGELAAPGTSGTLKWRYANGKTMLDITTSQENINRTAALESVIIAESVKQTALNLLEKYGIQIGKKGVISYNTSGERIAAAGACYKDTAAGIRALHGIYTRQSAPDEVGVRICTAE